MTGRCYSQRLGTLSTLQFQIALDRFQLGTFLHAEPVLLGNFEQNVFLTSTQGAFVLRGGPFDATQFPKEHWFMRQLHERTHVPVPWPYFLDRAEDIFGWSYIIMPRLSGLSLADLSVKQTLQEQHRRAIARAMGEMLAELHTLTWPYAGEYTLATDTIKAFEMSYKDQIIADIHHSLIASMESTERTTPADIVWVEKIVVQGQQALAEPFQACFIMGDYKEANVVVEGKDDQWYVSGVFDIHGSFGDAESDLSRPIAVYIDEGTPYLAQEFLRSYSVSRKLRPGFAERFPLYMLKERLAIWEWAHRVNNIWWDERLTLREWAEPFTQAYTLL